MPIYEYKCPKGHVFETFQKMTDEPPEVCEVCGEGPVQRILYPVAVHFKGSGFYTTDYARKATAKASTDGGSDSKESKDSKDSKADKKPAASSSKKDD